MFCDYCGKKLPENAQFCRHCGRVQTSLNKGESTPERPIHPARFPVATPRTPVVNRDTPPYRQEVKKTRLLGDEERNTTTNGMLGSKTRLMKPDEVVREGNAISPLVTETLRPQEPEDIYPFPMLTSSLNTIRKNSFYDAITPWWKTKSFLMVFGISLSLIVTLLFLSGLGVFEQKEERQEPISEIQEPLNHAPNKPFTSIIGSNYPDIEGEDIVLSWICLDPDGDELTYTVYFDDELLGATVLKSLSVPTNGMKTGEHTWWVVAEDSSGETSKSESLAFTFHPALQHEGETDAAPAIEAALDVDDVEADLKAANGGYSTITINGEGASDPTRSQNVIADAVSSALSTTRSAYNALLKDDPTVAGSSNIIFTIKPDGSVSNVVGANNNLPPGSFLGYILGGIRGLNFGAIEGGVVKINCIVSLTPQGGVRVE